MLEFIILGFLMFGATSGYDLKQRMTISTSYFFDASFGSIYPALKRLTEKNMVTFNEVVDGGKYKKLYHITDIGKSAFLNWLEEPIIFEKSRHDHLVKIFFYEFITKEKAIENLKEFMYQVKLVTDELTNQKNNVVQKYDVNRFIYRYETMHYGTEYYNFLLNWCEHLIEKLESHHI